MREKRTVQSSIFEAYGEHDVGRELKAMSEWLDSHPQLLDAVMGEIHAEHVDGTRTRREKAEDHVEGREPHRLVVEAIRQPAVRLALPALRVVAPTHGSAELIASRTSSGVTFRVLPLSARDVFSIAVMPWFL